MKPKILFLNHTGALGGAELCLLDVASHYSDSGKVLLFTHGPFRKRLEEVGVAVDVLPAPQTVGGIRREGGMIRDLQAVPGILRLVRQVAVLAQGYEVLYASSQKAFVVGALAGRLAGRPVIWHLHDALTADHFSAPHLRVAVALANRFTSRIIANSKATAVAFEKSGGRAKDVRVVYNGIDSRPFHIVAPAEVDTLRRASGLTGVRVVGVFSRLAPWKGQHILLEALTQLPEVHALLVGEALFGEYAYAEALRETAEFLKLTDRVHFLGFRDDIPRLMRLSDIVLHTSTVPEPFGRVIVEGMLARRPVVASRAGGAVEIIQDGVTGALITPGDPEALVRVLADLLTDPYKRHAFAEAGYASALKRFSLQEMREKIEWQVNEVVASWWPNHSERSSNGEEPQ